MADSMLGKIEVLIEQQVCFYFGRYHVVSLDPMSDSIAGFSYAHEVLKQSKQDWV